MLFPAPTTDLNALHDLLASTQSITQRWLDHARTKDEPPSITDISNLTLATRRIGLLHRDIYYLENPGLRFPSPPKATSLTRNPTQADAPSPDELNADASELHSSNFALHNSPIPTYPREVSRYVAAAILASDKFDATKAAPQCPDLYDEMEVMKSNPDYLFSVITEMTAATSDPVALPNSESSPNQIQSDDPSPSIHDPNLPLDRNVESTPSSIAQSEFTIRNSPSVKPVTSVALGEHSSEPADPLDPVIPFRKTASRDPSSRTVPLKSPNSLPPRVLLALSNIVLQNCPARAGPDDP